MKYPNEWSGKPPRQGLWGRTENLWLTGLVRGGGLPGQVTIEPCDSFICGERHWEGTPDRVMKDGDSAGHYWAQWMNQFWIERWWKGSLRLEHRRPSNIKLSTDSFGKINHYKYGCVARIRAFLELEAFGEAMTSGCPPCFCIWRWLALNNIKNIFFKYWRNNQLDWGFVDTWATKQESLFYGSCPAVPFWIYV